MRGLTLSVFLWALLTIYTGATGKTKHPQWGAEYCHEISKFNFVDMRKLFEDDTAAFTEEISQHQGSSAPSLEDLTTMFKSLKKGEVPEYIENNSYVIFTNQTSTFSHSVNTGTIVTIGYAANLTDIDNEDPLNVLVFNFINGTFGEYEYNVGNAYFHSNDYVQEADSLTWIETVKGAFIGSPSPGSEYVQYGSYDGVGEGTANLTCSEVQFATDFMFIMNMTQYFAKAVEKTSGSIGPTSGIINAAMDSITGGSNTTMSFIHSGFSPTDGIVATKGNGTVRNSKQEASVRAESSGYVLFDASRPFNKENLPSYFALATLDIGYSLPE